ncbi:multidrug effflux MFS transporter [Sphingomonas sp. C3-2]|uniref:multidrug effflux MFS transporter n=1 Tax=Sphingomonas sp. C3-2 TaxID=3062169 RepID=UPI00294B064A|nr:multidrug effflux MFS transporter [Sphingomonas sp. C3-2]WOK35639.1 multidrug effflux MFS transporter [Sphingomonas sp. C3-2]
MSTPAPASATEGFRPGFREFVAIIASVMALVALGIDAMLPALPAIGDSLGVTLENHRQYVISAFMLGFGLAQIVIGTMSDRFGRRPVLIAALGGYAVFAVVAAFAPSFEMLLLARALQGASAAGGRVLVTSIVRDRYAGRQMARVMSLAFIIFMAAPILAPAVGQAVLLFAPWRWIFAVLAIAGAALLIWVTLRLPETLAPENRAPITPRRIATAFGRVVRDRQSSGYTLALSLLTGALYGFINSVQQVVSQTFGKPELLVVVFGAVASTMAFGSFFNSRFVVRWGMRYIGHWALIGFILFSVLHFVISLAGHETLVSFMILQAAIMACFGLATSNFGALAMEHLGDVAGTASSLQGSFSTIFGAGIGVAIGQSFDGTTVPLYGGFTLCGLLALGVLLIVERGKLFHRSPE